MHACQQVGHGSLHFMGRALIASCPVLVCPSALCARRQLLGSCWSLGLLRWGGGVGPRSLCVAETRETGPCNFLSVCLSVCARVQLSTASPGGSSGPLFSSGGPAGHGRPAGSAQQTAGRIEDFSRPAGVALPIRPPLSASWWSSFCPRAAAELPRAWMGWRAVLLFTPLLGPQLSSSPELDCATGV